MAAPTLSSGGGATLDDRQRRRAVSLDDPVATLAFRLIESSVCPPERARRLACFVERDTDAEARQRTEQPPTTQQALRHIDARSVRSANNDDELLAAHAGNEMRVAHGA